jgi:hypothetical protein
MEVLLNFPLFVVVMLTLLVPAWRGMARGG